MSEENRKDKEKWTEQSKMKESVKKEKKKKEKSYWCNSFIFISPSLQIDSLFGCYQILVPG